MWIKMGMMKCDPGSAADRDSVWSTQADILAGTILPDLESTHWRQPIYYDSFYFTDRYRRHWISDNLLPSGKSEIIHPGIMKLPDKCHKYCRPEYQTENYYSSIEVSFSLSKSCTNTNSGKWLTLVSSKMLRIWSPRMHLCYDKYAKDN